MSVVANLRVVISGVDKLSKSLSGPQKRLNALGKQFTIAGGAMTAAFTVPIVSFGKGVLEAGANFEKAMNRVGVLTEATGEELDALRKQARELGEVTAFSASEAAEAMGYLGMAGFETNQILAAMPATLDLAAAAQMDLGQTADIVSNILTGYNKDASETGAISDLLVKGFQSSNTNLHELGEAMSYVAPVAAGMRIQMTETTAAIGKLSDAGIKGSRAGTALRQSLAKLAKPTKSAREALDRLGIPKQNIVDAEGNVTSLRAVIYELENAGASTADMIDIFGLRAGLAMAALVNQGVGAFDDLVGKLENAEGAARTAAQSQMEGLAGVQKAFASAFESFKLLIADSGVLEFATKFMQKLTELMRWLSGLNKNFVVLGVVIAALVAIIGPLLLLTGAVMVVFAKLSPIIIGIVAAVSAVIAIFSVLFTYWNDIVGWIKGTWEKVWGAIPKPLQTAIKIMTAIFAPWIYLIREVISGFENVRKAASRVGKFFGLGKGKGSDEALSVGAERELDATISRDESRFEGTLHIEGAPPRSRVDVEEYGGLDIETSSGRLEPGMAY